jgi:hypothetical protein
VQRYNKKMGYARKWEKFGKNLGKMPPKRYKLKWET